MEIFTSKTGVITDTKLPILKTTYAVAETRIRKVNSSTQVFYIYQIKKTGKYENITASIEYLDLIEIIKALKY